MPEEDTEGTKEKNSDHEQATVDDGEGHNIDGKDQYQNSTIDRCKNASDVSDNKNVITVSEGLDFMLWHFEEPIWPRNLSTAATRDSQKPAHDRDRVLLYYQGSLMVDCCIAVYPNYEELAKMGFLPVGLRPRPTHLFMDLDLKDFNDIHEMDKALKSTLRNVRKQFDEEVVPTVIWSGGGYHIHLPLDSTVMPAYEELDEFRRYREDAPIWFMRYAEQILTKGKADCNHRTSFKSAMARVPGSRNSKYEDKATAQVRIIRRWNGVRAKPTEEFMLSDFLTWLVQQELEANERIRRRNAPRFASSSNSGVINWIEKILQTPIADYRKATISLVLAPYLLKVRKMSNEQAFNTIMDWSCKCALISPLRPSRREFAQKAHDSLQRAQSSPYFPMGFSRLVSDYPHMYQVYVIHSLNTGPPPPPPQQQ